MVTIVLDLELDPEPEPRLNNEVTDSQGDRIVYRSTPGLPSPEDDVVGSMIRGMTEQYDLVSYLWFFKVVWQNLEFRITGAPPPPFP